MDKGYPIDEGLWKFRMGRKDDALSLRDEGAFPPSPLVG
jgi:hypothetical protein